MKKRNASLIVIICFILITITTSVNANENQEVLYSDIREAISIITNSSANALAKTGAREKTIPLETNAVRVIGDSINAINTQALTESAIQTLSLPLSEQKYSFGISGNYDYNAANELLLIINELREDITNFSNELFGEEVVFPPYMADEKLMETAMQRAAEIAILFDTIRPDGTPFSTAYPSDYLVGEDWYVGENIYVIKSSDVYDVFIDWFYSENTLENLINLEFTKAGVGCFYQDEEYYWVLSLANEGTPTASVKTGIQVETKTVTALRENLMLEISSTEEQILKNTTYQFNLFNTLNRGWSLVDKVKIEPSFYETVNPGVAVVDSHGVVTGVGTGDTTLRLGVGSDFYEETNIIVRQRQDIFVEDIPSKVYGDPEFYLSVLPDSTSMLNHFYYVSSNPEIAQVDGAGKVTIVGVGQADIIISQPGDSEYALTRVTKPLLVEKRILTATATAINREYNGTTNVNVTILPDNLVPGDDLAITAIGTMNDADAGENKTVVISDIQITGLSAINYIAPTPIPNAIVSITKVKATGVNQTMYVKAGLAHIYSFELTKLIPTGIAEEQISAFTVISGNEGIIIDGGLLDITKTTLSVPIRDSATAGEAVHKIVVGLTSRNYDIIDATITIDVLNKTPVEARVSLPEKVYDGKTYSVAGLVELFDVISGEKVSGIDLAYEYAIDYGFLDSPVYWNTTAPKDVSQYFLRITGKEHDKYFVQPLIVRFEIFQKEITIVADDKVMTVGWSPREYTYTIRGQINGENVFSVGKPTVTCAANMTVPGLFTIVVDITDVGLLNNYKWATPPTQNGTLTVNPLQGKDTGSSNNNNNGGGSPTSSGGGGTPLPSENKKSEEEKKTEEENKSSEIEENDSEIVDSKIPRDPVTWENPFDDVVTTDWFYENIAWVHQCGFMNGVSATSFSPETPLTRAMFAQLIYNYAGASVVDGENPFDDVPSDAWYCNAVVWAVNQEKEIIRGYGNGLFGPDDEITREQIMLLLFNYANLLEIDTSVRADVSNFSDLEDISDWAMEAVQYMVAKEVVRGRTDTTLVPLGSATRAEVATIIRNFDEKVNIK